MRSSSSQRRFFACLLGALAAVPLLERPLAAGPKVFFPATGNYYERVDVASGITWTEAMSAATELRHGDVPGRLVTIGSAAENEFLSETFLRAARADRYPRAFQAWIGGFQPFRSGEPRGGWQWVTGEPFGYTNWDTRAPDNIFGDENAICVFGPGGNQGRWNDLGSEWRITSYLVEYESAAAPQAEDKSLWRVSALDIPQPGGDMQAARDELGRIYIPLGVDPELARSRHDVVRFDESDRSWQLVAPLEAARSFSAGATDYLGRIYCIGGRDDGPLASVERYDAVLDRWTFVTSLPEARWGAQAVADASGRNIYVLGGQLAASAAATPTVVRYDVDGNRWVPAPPMSVPRVRFGAARGADGSIYAVGGSAGLSAGDTGSTVERFEPRSGQWTRAAPLAAHPEDVGAAIADACGYVYAIGGRDDGFSGAVERYVPARDAWEPCPSLAQPRTRMATALSNSGRIYVFGGETGAGAPQVEFTSACAPRRAAKAWKVSVKFILDGEGNRAAVGTLNSDEEVEDQIDVAKRILCATLESPTLVLTEIVDLERASHRFSLNCRPGERDTLQSEAQSDPARYAWRLDAINVYVVGELAGCGGICSFPHSGSEIIVMGQRASATTLLHELGHYFGLCHTQGCQCGACEEDGGPCSTIPEDDGIGDTLPDLACWTSDDIAFGAFGVDYDSLTSDQKTLVDDTFFNVMSYHPNSPERSRLTAEQTTRLLEGAELRDLGIAALLESSPCREDDPGDRGAVSDYFLRGDANVDGQVDLGDAVYTLNHLFAGGAVPSCEDAADSNDDGGVGLADPVFTLGALFGGGNAIPPPGTHACGPDPTADARSRCVYDAAACPQSLVD